MQLNADQAGRALKTRLVLRFPRLTEDVALRCLPADGRARQSKVHLGEVTE